ncbi:hypothetical protein SAMN05421740_11525 [Parapedobacter koreensis]|uniref:Uncharacterized protein n=1 Tax=Parapedobacter koreensis TaxID=332977 RepID=A0A1H7UEG9_9SPHI|nr:hypothetical protein SAMN05421740_11525 [Parapedobacter koreensis]
MVMGLQWLPIGTVTRYILSKLDWKELVEGIEVKEG